MVGRPRAKCRRLRSAQTLGPWVTGTLPDALPSQRQKLSALDAQTAVLWLTVRGNCKDETEPEIVPGKVR